MRGLSSLEANTIKSRFRISRQKFSGFIKLLKTYLAILKLARRLEALHQSSCFKGHFLML